MLECAIPDCVAREKFLRSGSLHLVDVARDGGATTKRMIWLCSGCSRKYAVQTWREPGQQIRPRNICRSFSVKEIVSVPVGGIMPKPVKLLSAGSIAQGGPSVHLVLPLP